MRESVPPVDSGPRLPAWLSSLQVFSRPPVRHTRDRIVRPACPPVRLPACLHGLFSLLPDRHFDPSAGRRPRRTGERNRVRKSWNV